MTVSINGTKATGEYSNILGNKREALNAQL